ncbi:CinA family protein [Desulfovibrio aminophilus]|nr:CinA family protein [Desulfovibrio aminophilus]MCM0755882.1 CinA family protein [Desulfovibrio aminophilus]
MDEKLEGDILELGAALRARGLTLACAESCTGGLLAGALTSVAGSSDWFLGGVVAYHDLIKTRLLDVPETRLRRHGAVSEPVVAAMAHGARGAFCADLAVSISGIAGPGGGTPEKPVGTVWMAWASPEGVTTRKFLFEGDRAGVRDQSVAEAVAGLLALAGRG